MKNNNLYFLPLTPGKQKCDNERLIFEALNSLEDCIEIVNAYGQIVFSSKRFLALDGISRENIQNQAFVDFYNLNDKNSVMIKTWMTGLPIKKIHTVYTPKDGRPINAICDVYPIFLDKVIAGVIAITRDSLRVKQLIDELVLIKQISIPQKKKDFDNGTRFKLENIWGETKIIKETIDSAWHISKTSVSVLIYGETGTGKELFAQGIHNASDRASHKFVALNCSALPETLMEGLLFGTSKGAYTGAESRPGFFEEANRGTLFLDEINSMPLSLQAKLLRVLEDGRIRRLGSNHDTVTDVRIISAMNITPEEAIVGKFIRQDIFYRLSSFTFECPPLRRRTDDILVYCLMYIHIYRKMLGRKVESISRQAIERLVKYPWHGNVRELKHLIESTVISMKQNETTMDTRHFPSWLAQGDNPPGEQGGPAQTEVIINTDNYPQDPYDYNDKIRTLEINLIKDALTINHENLSKTARFLHISKQSLAYKLKCFNIRIKKNIQLIDDNYK